MVKVPDEITKEGDVREIRSAIKERTMKITREENLELKHIVLERDYPFATVRIRRADDPGNTLSIDVVRELREAFYVLADWSREQENLRSVGLTSSPEVARHVLHVEHAAMLPGTALLLEEELTAVEKIACAASPSLGELMAIYRKANGLEDRIRDVAAAVSMDDLFE